MERIKTILTGVLFLLIGIITTVVLEGDATALVLFAVWGVGLIVTGVRGGCCV